jgi:hypothetical protein
MILFQYLALTGSYQDSEFIWSDNLNIIFDILTFLIHHKTLIHKKYFRIILERHQNIHNKLNFKKSNPE